MAIDSLLNRWLPIRYQTPQERRICPICCTGVEDTERGLFCPMCGWTPSIPIPFIPRTPDSSIQ